MQPGRQGHELQTIGVFEDVHMVGVQQDHNWACWRSTSRMRRPSSSISRITGSSANMPSVLRQSFFPAAVADCERSWATVSSNAVTRSSRVGSVIPSLHLIRLYCEQTIISCQILTCGYVAHDVASSRLGSRCLYRLRGPNVASLWAQAPLTRSLKHSPDTSLSHPLPATSITHAWSREAYRAYNGACPFAGRTKPHREAHHTLSQEGVGAYLNDIPVRPRFLLFNWFSLFLLLPLPSGNSPKSC